MRRPGQQGFTLIELMTAVALTAVLGGAMVSLAESAQRGAAATDQNYDLLNGYREALTLLAADVRESLGIEGIDGGLRITTADGQRAWAWNGTELVRVDSDGRRRTVAREVRALIVEPEGDLWRLRLEFGRDASITTAVLPRAEGQR